MREEDTGLEPVPATFATPFSYSRFYTNGMYFVFCLLVSLLVTVQTINLSPVIVGNHHIADNKFYCDKTT